MTRARIGLIGPLPPPSGGMANQTRQLSALLCAEGAHVEVVQTNAAYRPSCIAEARGVRALFRLLPFVFRLWQCAGRVDLFHVMANSGWAWHLFAVPAICVGRLRRIPVIVNYRGGAAAEFLHRSGGLVRAVMRLSDALIVPTSFLVAVFERHQMQARIVPNIVDLKRFAPGDSRCRRPDSGPHIVCTRNLEPIYDIAAALEAFAIVRGRYPGARLTLAGSGPERSRLEAAAQRLGIAASVVFTGRLDNEEIAALYRSADVSLNPSRVDNTPVSILEALAAAVPVVSTDAGGIPYLVKHRETALLVPVGDTEAMAAAVVELMQNSNLRAALTAAGRDFVQQFSWNAVRPQLVELYAELIRKHTPAAAAHAE